MRRNLFFLVLLIGLIAYGTWSPVKLWVYDLSYFFGVSKVTETSGLHVFSLDGELKIYIDGVLQGSVNVDNSPHVIDNVSVGKHLVQLEKFSQVDNAYEPVSKSIYFEKGKTVVMTYNIGPIHPYISGHVIFVQPKDEYISNNNVIIKANIPNLLVYIDEVLIEKRDGYFESNIDFESQHVLFAEAKGFESTEFTILPRDRNERESLKGFQIVVELDLMKQPVIIEEVK